jgi:hypothetical protein
MLTAALSASRVVTDFATPRFFRATGWWVRRRSLAMSKTRVNKKSKRQTLPDELNDEELGTASGGIVTLQPRDERPTESITFVYGTLNIADLGSFTFKK